MTTRQTGFTLIEIMVVMVVLSFGLVAVVAAAAQAARSTTAVQELEILRQAAEDVLAVEILKPELGSGSSQGQAGRVGWTLNISDDPDFETLKEITVTTRLLDRPNGRTFQLVTQQAQLKSSEADSQ